MLHPALLPLSAELLFPAGPFGTRADWLIDLIICSLAAIVPLLVYSTRRARRGGYARHAAIQKALAAVLLVAVLLFEIDIRMGGGVYELAAGGRFAESLWLDLVLAVHLVIAIATVVIWAGLVVGAVRRFPRPPAPGPHSDAHRRWGRLGVAGMILTGLSGGALYTVAFWL